MALSNLRATLLCFMCTESEDVNYTNEKNALLSYQDSRNAAHIADDVMDIIRSTSLSGPALEMQLDSIVGMYGWTENVAKWVLEKLCHLLEQEERKLGPTVHEAYHRAWEVAKSIEGFVIEHPVFCTIIALGVLVIIAPWVIEALGFAEIGPVEGSFASWWQSTYGGLVPKGSLFSFFQRLGMVWH